MSVAQSEAAEAGLGLPTAIFASAQFVMVLDSSVAIGAVGVFAVLALWFTRGLPGRPGGPLESTSLAEAS
jgi:hypothetical protein